MPMVLALLIAINIIFLQKMGTCCAPGATSEPVPNQSFKSKSSEPATSKSIEKEVETTTTPPAAKITTENLEKIKKLEEQRDEKKDEYKHIEDKYDHLKKKYKKVKHETEHAEHKEESNEDYSIELLRSISGYIDKLLGGEGTQPGEADQDQLIVVIKTQLEKLHVPAMASGKGEEDVEELKEKVESKMRDHESNNSGISDAVANTKSAQLDKENYDTKISESQTAIENL